MLSNRIGNAIKFVPDRGTIVVQASAQEAGVRLAVVDSGPGIPAEDLSRLFDRDWRAPETVHLGAGLGLAISKGIVRVARRKHLGRKRTRLRSRLSPDRTRRGGGTES